MILSLRDATINPFPGPIPPPPLSHPPLLSLPPSPHSIEIIRFDTISVKTFDPIILTVDLRKRNIGVVKFSTLVKWFKKKQ